MNTAEHNFPKRAHRLMKMAHPLELQKAQKLDQNQLDVSKSEGRDVTIHNPDGSIHIRKADGTRIYNDKKNTLSIVKPDGNSLVQKENSAVQIRSNGTVVTFNEDGSRSEIRPNGTIIAYFADGSIKFFRTGCWSG